MIRPSGAQLKEIQDALLSAYPSENDLAQMVRFELDIPLSSVASGGNQTEIIFQLLNWAESQGSVDRLLGAALRRNPGNPSLQRVVAKLSSDDWNQKHPDSKGQERTPSSDAPFLGPVPFSAHDATIFFGRDIETETIVKRILKDKLLVINGRSGSGKTSILRAAVIPRIEAQGGLVLYASILDSPRSDVVRAIEGVLPQTYAAHEDIVAALSDVTQPSTGLPVVLVVDQLERCFAVSTPPDERNLFWRDVARIIADDTRTPVRLVLIVRADWLYAFQTAVPFSEIIPVFSFIYMRGVHNVR
jgi:hypothetical protein